MAVETTNDRRIDATTVLGYLRVAVYVLTTVLALSLLVVGAVAIIAQLKGTWHWQIHLESTISYMAVFVTYLLAVLVPAFGLFVVGRWVVDDA